MYKSSYSMQVFCFLAAILYGLAVIWEVIFIVDDLNDKVVKYTLKEAVKLIPEN